MQVAFLMMFGVFVGTLGTMLGIGGGWLHVPFLMLVFNFTPQKAIADSIGIIFFNTLAGSLIYYSQKRIDVDLAKKMAVAVLPGAILGPILVQRYTSNFFFFFFFSLLLVGIALYMFWQEKPIRILPAHRYNRVTTITDKLGHSVTYRTSVELGVIGTFIIGFIANLFGIGGGIIHVPFLILFLGIPTHIALGTSHFILCISSGIGLVMFTIMGNVEVDFMMPIALGAILGARIGAEFARRTRADILRRMLAAVVLIVAFRMFLRGLGK